MSPDHQIFAEKRADNFRAQNAAKLKKAATIDPPRLDGWRALIEEKLGADRAQQEIEQLRQIHLRINPDLSTLDHEARVLGDTLRSMGINPLDV